MLVAGNRVTLAGVLLGGVLLFAAVLTSIGILSGRPSSPMYFLFSAFLGGNFTLISVVLSINQLVLSRELGAPGELRRRIEDALEYREDAQERADQSVAPVLPGSFLRFLHETTEARTEELRESVADTLDDRLQNRVETFADNVLTDVKAVLQTLDTEPVQIFAVIEATLGTNHAQ